MGFIEFFDKVAYENRLVMGLEYSRMTDWNIRISKRDKPLGEDTVIFQGDSPDLEYLSAKAEVALKDWLLKERGGY